MCYGNVSGTQCSTSVVYSASIGYDGLNRPRRKDYTDGTAPNYTDRTPAVVYAYDQDLSGGGANYPKGRLVSVASGATTVQFNRFDKMGRVLNHTQLGSTNYPFTYVYNLAGLLTNETYPSGRVVNTNYDGAGRIAGVSGTLNGSTTNYVGTPAGQDIKYWAHGGIYQLKLGNTLWEQWTYNSRLQPTAMALGTSPGSPSVRGMTLDYGSLGNNGNVMGETIAGAGLSAQVSQTYGYDRLNRITSSGKGTAWTRSFDYDRYGNGWVTNATGISASTFTPQSSGAYNVSNQLLLTGGSTYDAAGNQTVAGTFGFTYDAENRLVKSAVNSTTVCVYDGDGRRVGKADCAGATCGMTATGAHTTEYVYDAFGQVVAEMSNTLSVSPCTTCWVTGDHLGSTRVLTKESGTAAECHDYLPFGEEILAGTGGRSGCYGGSPGKGRLFTGQERDGETENSSMPSGLDYFGARYFSGAQGRFTSPDKVFWSQRMADPQSWNLYTYAGNNPLRYTDPDGHDFHVCVDNGNCFDMTGAQYQKLYDQQNGQNGVGMPVYNGPGSGGAITCGGTVCGSATYFEPGGSMGRDSSSIGLGIIGGKAASAVLSKAVGWVAGFFGRAASNVVELNPSAVAFTQRTVNGVEEWSATFRANGGWVGGPIDVVQMEDGTLAAIDNSRVVAAGQTGYNVQATVHVAGDMINPERAQSFLEMYGERPSTWGEAAKMRINDQGAAFRSTYPNGSPVTPRGK